ncbi:MAG TPA: hypothetical protein ENF33_01700 [Nitrososphaeria archaeon]|nr:MAG: hypothetical protein DRJ43_05030 [Thermoprotei archaeon]HDJ66416.1 hypothetical protein [Nitrososphaeria archaeon]
MNPDEFENLCANLLKRMAYRDAKRVGGSGDIGLDTLHVDRYSGRAGI